MTMNKKENARSGVEETKERNQDQQKQAVDLVPRQSKDPFRHLAQLFQPCGLCNPATTTSPAPSPPGSPLVKGGNNKTDATTASAAMSEDSDDSSNFDNVVSVDAKGKVEAGEPPMTILVGQQQQEQQKRDLPVNDNGDSAAAAARSAFVAPAVDLSRGTSLVTGTFDADADADAGSTDSDTTSSAAAHKREVGIDDDHLDDHSSTTQEERDVNDSMGETEDVVVTVTTKSGPSRCSRIVKALEIFFCTLFFFYLTMYLLVKFNRTFNLELTTKDETTDSTPLSFS